MESTNSCDEPDGPFFKNRRGHNSGDSTDNSATNHKPSPDLSSISTKKRVRNGSGPFARAKRLSEAFEIYSFEDAKNAFKSCTMKNVEQKLELAKEYLHFQDPIYGNTLIHAAIESRLGDVNVKAELVRRLLSLGADPTTMNKAGKPPIFVAIDLDLLLLIPVFDSFNPGLLTMTYDAGLTATAYAARKPNLKALDCLFKCQPDLKNKKLGQNGTPVHYVLTRFREKDIEKQQRVQENAEPSSFSEHPNVDEEEKRIMKSMIEAIPLDDLLSTSHHGNLLHLLAFLDIIEWLEALVGRLIASGNESLLERLLNTKDNEGKTPLIYALENSRSNHESARYLLDNGASADVVWTKSTKTWSTIEIALRCVNVKKKAVEVVKKLLQKMSPDNLENAIESIVEAVNDDSSLNMELLKILLKHGHRHKIPELINHQDDTTKYTAMHTLVQSSYYEDVAEDLSFLLENGGDVMLRAWRDSRVNEHIVPVHIATSLQYSYEVYGMKSYGKLRLTQYLTCLKRIGLEKLLQGKSEAYMVDFFKHHLIPGVYNADSQFVYCLLNQMFKLPPECQFDILHFKITNSSIVPRGIDSYVAVRENEDKSHEDLNWGVFYLSALYWATSKRSSANNILSDIVRAEYYVHNVPGELATTGMDCFVSLPSSDQRDIAVAMYKAHFLSNNKYSAFFTSLVTILLLKYALFAFDIYLDIDLIYNYQEQYLKSEQDNEAANYHIAFIMSIALMVPSALAYFLLSYLIFKPPKRLLNAYNNTAWKTLVKILNPMTFIVTFFGRNVISLSDPKSSVKLLKYSKCEELWNFLRRIEIGIEATGQILVQLWLFVPFMPEIHEWDWAEAMQHFWTGLGDLLFPWLLHQANFLELMLAKFCLSFLIICISITLIRTSKSKFEPLSVFTIFLSTVLQVVSRIMTIRLFFYLDVSGLTKFVTIIGHIVIEICIKVMLEWPPLDEENGWCMKNLQLGTRAFTSAFSGILVFMNIDISGVAVQPDANHYKKTVLPATCHFLICFIEHVVVCIMGPKNASVHYLWAPPFLMLGSIASLAVYYLYLHPLSASIGRSEKFLCCFKMREVQFSSISSEDSASPYSNGHVKEDVVLEMK